MLLRYLSLLLICVSMFVGRVSAQEQSFYNNYKVDYTLSEQNDSLMTRVKFTISITNLKTTEYVGNISLTFPQSFTISDVIASDDKGVVKPEVTTEGAKSKIKLTFNDPAIGKNTINTFHMEFNQANLFRSDGNVWEMIVPTVDDGARTSYSVAVHIPATVSKKLSIAKPIPDKVEGNTIIWNNPTTRTIYAIFGDKQYYQLNLNYHLRNPKLIPVYDEIAFPPDTAYQKTFVNSVQPTPYSVRIDEDGNLLARYNLKPKESLDIKYDGEVEVNAQPRENVMKYTRQEFDRQKSYLLTPEKYWKLNDSKEITELKNASDIYYYVSKNLKYDYSKLKKTVKRMGAQQALMHPEEAICMEFADTFVAIAREKGIYAREIEGYGFSQDPQLRPLSAKSDVLHAWPEYYDNKRDIWTQIDPTWENTSGIDYFSSFDLSHIVFAIHGRDPDYPYPAGSYKIEDSKDVNIKAVGSKPTENILLAVKPFSIPKQINDRNEYKTKMKLHNQSNVFLWDVPVTIRSSNISISSNISSIPVLAPFEEKELLLTYRSNIKNKKGSGSFDLIVMNNKMYEGKFAIIPYYYTLALKISYVILGFSVVFLVVFGIRKIKPF